MKSLIVLTIALLFNSFAFAGEGEPTAAEVREAVIDMMLENTEGMELLSQYGKYGLTLSFLKEETVRLEVLKETDTEVVVAFEVELTDCRGTDACGSSYVWKVTATTKTDGYVYETKYENEVTEVSAN